MKRFFTLFYLLLPGLLASGFAWGIFQASTYLIVIYIITIISMILFMAIKPCGYWTVLVGVIASPIPMFIYEAIINSEIGIAGFTGFIIIFYTIPITLLAITLLAITAFIRAFRKRNT